MNTPVWNLRQPGLFDELDPPDVQNRRVYELGVAREQRAHELRLRMAQHHMKLRWCRAELYDLTGQEV